MANIQVALSLFSSSSTRTIGDSFRSRHTYLQICLLRRVMAQQPRKRWRWRIWTLESPKWNMRCEARLLFVLLKSKNNWNKYEETLISVVFHVCLSLLRLRFLTKRMPSNSPSNEWFERILAIAMRVETKCRLPTSDRFVVLFDEWEEESMRFSSSTLLVVRIHRLWNQRTFPRILNNEFIEYSQPVGDRVSERTQRVKASSLFAKISPSISKNAMVIHRTRAISTFATELQMESKRWLNYWWIPIWRNHRESWFLFHNILSTAPRSANTAPIKSGIISMKRTIGHWTSTNSNELWKNQKSIVSPVVSSSSILAIRPVREALQCLSEETWTLFIRSSSLAWEYCQRHPFR